eukprot:scaffold29050_cov112-Isochrysis_galbana.AAC.1
MRIPTDGERGLCVEQSLPISAMSWAASKALRSPLTTSQHAPALHASLAPWRTQPTKHST